MMGFGGKRWLLLAFLAAVIVRVLVGVWVIRGETLPVGDEWTYINRAYDLGVLIDNARQGLPIEASVYAEALDNGIHPPVNVVIYSGIVLAQGVETVAADDARQTVAYARWFVMIVSMLTTVLVYLLTRQIAGERAALAATWVWALNPVFVAFSHFLWAETLFIFLVLLALLLLIKTRDNIYLALAVGALLGAATLTRAIGLVFLGVVVLWLFFQRDTSDWLARCLFVALTAALLILPWSNFLSRSVGYFAPVTTVNTLNLFLGNNPAAVTALGGSTTGDLKEAALVELGAYQSEHELDERTAMREIALAEIRRDPGAALLRSLARLRATWASDWFIMRHFVRGTYPPISYGATYLLWGVVVVTHIALILAAVYGGLVGDFRLPRYKLLLVTLVLVGTLPPLLTIAISRYNIPLQALLLPLVGAGITAHRRPSRRMTQLLVGVALVLTASVLTALPVLFRYEVLPASEPYQAFADQVAGLLGVELVE